MQLEKDKYAAQLAEALKLKKVLDQVNISKKRDTADLGSLVITNSGAYFLSVGIGQIRIEGREYYVISLASPIGILLKGKRAGESFLFNGKKVEVVEIA